MTKLQIRTILYGLIAGLQTLVLGINDGSMTGRDWIQLAFSSVLAAAIAIRALYDTAPDDVPAAANKSIMENTVVARAPVVPQTGTTVANANAETKRVEVPEESASELGQPNLKTEGKP